MFVDIHSHIIPWIDDGAENIGTALEMLKIAAANGTRFIAATPHYISDAVFNTSSMVTEKCLELQKLANDEGIDISIYPGSELLISSHVTGVLKNDMPGSINNSSYLLIEFPMSGIPACADDVVYFLQLKGLIPIIAHPERNLEVLRDTRILDGFLSKGLLLQVNAGSITGFFGRKVQKTAMKLIKSGMAHFVASDAHSCNERSPNIGSAAGIVEKECSGDIVERLFYKNGLAVLEDRELPEFSHNNLK